MARRNLYDILNMQAFDPEKEHIKLKNMFERETIGATGYSCFRYINNECFRYFPDRGRYLSLEEMKKAIDNYAFTQKIDALDHFLLYCEFLKFVIEQNLQINGGMSFAHTMFDAQMELIDEQMERVLGDSNHEWLQRKDGSFIVVDKNPIAINAAGIVPDDNASIKIMEYNHFSLKGDIDGKKAILKELGDIIEPILDSKEWKGSAYTKLGSDAGFLLNNFNIRHNNVEGANKKEYISKLSSEELERWYDKTYDCILAVITMNEQIKINAEIKKVKEQI